MPNTTTLQSPSKMHLIKQLQQKICRVETTSRNDDGTIVSSGSAAIDQMLPAGGYHRGTIIEWISNVGSSAEFLSLTTAREAALDGGALVVVDFEGHFYPPAAAAIGINLGNLIVLRPAGPCDESDTRDLEPDDFLWAIDQSLRCSAVAAVWSKLPDFEDSQSGQRWLRRFQLSAESSGCLGLFVRPLSACGGPSWSEIQWLIKPQSSPVGASCRRVGAQLVRCRGGTVGKETTLDISTLTGRIRNSEVGSRKRRKMRSAECGVRNFCFR